MAVYTEVSDDDLNAFAAEYDIGEVVSCKGIAEGIENTNYLLGTESTSYILTLYEKRVKEQDLPFFLALMEHLAASGIPCPIPVKGRDGVVLRRLSGRPAAIITFLKGMWPRRVTPAHCAGLGRAMARMHIAGADFALARPNDLSVQSWRPLLEASAPRADEVRGGLVGELAHELDELEAGWPSGLPGGVIHADLFPDNVFFRGETLTGLIDFYFACSDFFAYDVAVCLNAWCFEPDHSFNITKARRLLSAYRAERDFSFEELQALPLLARGSAMRFLLTRLYDWLNTPPDALVTRKDPLECLAKLRFHQAVAGPGDYGLD
ncbi:MAG: homoserine kinase [Rhodospirillales bacterium]|jgi:homoserine kinase type II|nr:homoserine kinase [Rhodospirillales bacterium]